LKSLPAQEVSAAYAAALAAAFPAIDPEFEPFGDRVLVQLRTSKKMSDGGIIIPDDAQETDQWSTQVAKVLALGDTAFKNQDTLESWKEGDWCEPGEFVRVTKYGGDRWRLPIPGTNDREFAIFIVFRDLDLLGRYRGDPLKVKAYLD
jgi:co-chaperonin GroES (HSP10)